MKLLTCILIILSIGALLVLALFVFQRYLIYFPRSYDRFYNLENFKTISLEYQTREGKQISFYLPPKSPKSDPPEVLWVVFGGNATLALDWYDFVQGYPDPRAGILLVEYPGYGFCEGKASPESILDSTEAAMDRLAEHLTVNREQLEKNLHILGHSLGTGAALQFAAKHPIQQVLLVAPFTSLLDMACRTVGKPLCFLLRHRFDNRTQLGLLAQRAVKPQVHIFHGTRDQVIPVKMGRELAKQFASITLYTEISNAQHNFIFSQATYDIYEVMQRGPSGEDRKGQYLASSKENEEKY